MQCPVDGCDFESESKQGVATHCGQTHSVEENPHRVKCECNNCGDEFTISRSTYENGQGKYCSMKCRSEHGTVECECDYCGDEFTIKKSKYDGGGGKYCSHKCRGSDKKKIVECECDYCGDIFKITESSSHTGKYCSEKCMGLDNRNQIECECDYCGDIFKITESSSHTGKYCSHKCRGLDNRNQIECECDYCGDIFKITESSSHTGKYCSHECYALDIRSANPDIRDSSEYRQFRQTVLERDNHRCVECGDGGDLHVHHVIPIYDDESLATDVDNGKTLCVECHAEAHEELGDPHLAALIRSDGTEFEISVSV